LRDRAKAEQSLREQLPSAGGKDGNGQLLGSIDSGIKQLGVQIAQSRLQNKGVLARVGEKQPAAQCGARSVIWRLIGTRLALSTAGR